jgi:hypothetical protein
MTETPRPTAKKSIEVPLSPEDLATLTEMAVADFRRPAQMAAKLLHEAIERATAIAPRRPSRAKPKPVAVEQGPLRMISGAVSPDELPYDKGGVIATSPAPAAADEAADSRPDRPDLRATHHGYGQRIVADVPQA